MSEISDKKTIGEHLGEIVDDVTSGAKLPGKNSYPTWVDLLAILGVFFGSMLLSGLIGGALVKNGNISKEIFTFSSYLFYFGITICFALWQRSVRGGGGVKITFSIKKISPQQILWGTLLVAAISFVLEPLLDLFPSMFMELLDDAVGRGWWAVLTTVVCAPVLEEFLFRGIIQGALQRKRSAFAAIMISSLIFGIIHGIPQQVINAFFIALILGFIYYRTGTLTGVIIIHAINNAIAYISMVITDGKFITMREVISNDTLYWTIYSIIAAGVACAFVMLGRTMVKDVKGKNN